MNCETTELSRLSAERRRHHDGQFRLLSAPVLTSRLITLRLAEVMNRL